MAKVLTVSCKHCLLPTRVDASGSAAKCVWCQKQVDSTCRVVKSKPTCEKCDKHIGDDFCDDCANGQTPKNTSTVAKGSRAVAFRKQSDLIGPYISWEQFNKDILEFADQLKGKGYDAVIGVPRSGMIVATQMSVRLGIPLYCVTEFGPVYLGGGLRVRRRIEDLPDPKKALLVEDSSASGFSFREAEKWMDESMSFWNVKKACLYVTRCQLKSVSEYFRQLELPHWFEWNLLWNQVIMRDRKVAVDFDGILCDDFTSEQDDDGWRYLDALKNMRCLVPQGTHLHAIITARLEKYRPWTEDWLRNHGVTFKHLIMGQWANKEEREKDCIAAYKAKNCVQVHAGMFIESDANQAKSMKQLIDIPILCPNLGGSFCG